jgi:hypothetical protein
MFGMFWRMATGGVIGDIVCWFAATFFVEILMVALVSETASTAMPCRLALTTTRKAGLMEEELTQRRLGLTFGIYRQHIDRLLLHLHNTRVQIPCIPLSLWTVLDKLSSRQDAATTASMYCINLGAHFVSQL